MAHIALLLPTLGGGGAERVALTLAAGLRDAGDRVTILLARAEGPFLAEVPDGVDIVDLGADRLRDVVGPLASWLRSAQLDALQASMWPLTSHAVRARARAEVKLRLMLTDHVNLGADRAGDGALHRLAMRGLMAATYRRADVLTAVSEGAAREVERLALLPRGRVTTIYNPIPLPVDAEGSVNPWPDDDPLLLSVGAFKPQKNHALLLEAFAKLLRQRPARLALVGEGVLRPALEAQARELGIVERVRFTGFVGDPSPWYAAADLFVLSSDYEGFGNVVAEALGHGVPVVSTDCPDGPAEILEDGRYGRLTPVGDADALADAMASALDASVDRIALRARAADFAPPAIVARYRELLLGTAA